jgi:quercetin dioxygenase-like cupin family protein
VDFVETSESAAQEDHSERFSGTVKIQQLHKTAEGSSVNAVFFEAGALTKPHIHVNDQVLYCINGEALVGITEGDSVSSRIWRLRPGQSVRIPRGTWHWHGASTGGDMCHLSIYVHDDNDQWENVPLKRLGCAPRRITINLKTSHELCLSSSGL